VSDVAYLAPKNPYRLRPRSVPFCQSIPHRGYAKYQLAGIREAVPANVQCM
jgi:hypothetical protein